MGFRRFSMSLDASRRFRLKLLLVVLLMSCALPVGAQRMMDPCQVFGVGDCDITVGKVVNVYWDLSLQKFDSDEVPSLPTHEAIDEYLAALLHSSYLNGLSQYQVASVVMLPSLAGSACVSTNMSLQDLWSNPPDVDVMIKCIVGTNPSLTSGSGQLILNFILPPGGGNSTGGSDLAFCKSQSPPIGAWHLQQSQVYTIIPIGCLNSLANVETAISHEMVEALTDPNHLAGWSNWGNENEVADECENGATKTAPFLLGFVSQYWSNSDNACISSLGSNPPIAQDETICGSGQNMIITVRGNFPFPSWDMTSNAFLGQTPYIVAQVNLPSPNQSISWSAGLPVAIPSNQLVTPVGFSSIQENSSLITLNGFTNVYGTTAFNVLQTAPPGSRIKTTVIDPISGAAAPAVSATVPGPNSIYAFDVFSGPAESYLFVNNTAQVWGQVLDSGRCADADVQVGLHASAGSFQASGGSSVTLTTDALGKFSTAYTAPSVAGLTTVGVSSPVPTSLQVPVYPIITGIQPAIGPVAGGQPVTVSGSGFQSPTTVSFNGTPASNPVPQNTDVLFSSPRSPLGGDGSGDVDVSLNVSGVQGLKTLTYQYVVPGKPVLTFQPSDCTTAILTATIYDSNGSPITGTNYDVVLSGPAKSISGANGRTNSVTVQSGQLVTVFAGGPFTAVGRFQIFPTNAWKVTGTATETFPWIRNICGEGFDLLKGYFRLTLDLPPGALAPHIGSCDFCGVEKPIFWGNPRSLFLSVMGNESLATVVTIRTLDTTTSRQTFAESSRVLGLRSIGADFRSPIVQISNKGRTEGPLPVHSKLGIPIAGSKPLPNGRFEIVRLVRAGSMFVWSQDRIKNRNVTGNYISATIQESGAYAVVEVNEKSSSPTR